MRVTEVSVDRDLAGYRGARWHRVGAVPAGDTPVVTSNGVEVVLDRFDAGPGTRIALRLRNPGTSPVAVAAVRLRTDARPDLVLDQGYQSWSPVGYRAVDDVPARRRLTPTWARGMYHAAPWLAGRAVAGDQYLVMGDGTGGSEGTTGGAGTGVVGFLDGRHHLSTVVAGPDGVWAAAWMDDVVLAPGAERALDPLWLGPGDPAVAVAEYAARWGAEADARTGHTVPSGWCSWYRYFWKVTPEDVRSNLEVARAHGFSLVQIDDGYQRAVGDWLEVRPSWGGGPAGTGEVGRLAGEITAAGLTAGLWTAPFLATRRSRVMERHPEWFVRNRRGRPLGAMWNPLAWGGWAYALDTTRPDVLDHLREVYASLSDLGFDYHKLDFLYAAAMVGRRQGDGTTTRAQALRPGLVAIREAVGDDLLVGCGCPLAQAVGLVEFMRVSPDTAPRWTAGLTRMPGYTECAPAASNAVRASTLRAPLHGALWTNDPDCLLLRTDHSRLTADQRAVVNEVAAAVGGMAVVSDDLTAFGPDEWRQVDRLAGAVAATGGVSVRPSGPDGAEVVAGDRRLGVSWSATAPRALRRDRPRDTGPDPGP